ncbi:MAG TPA: APC family permease [Gemmatimonadales bacterium]|nr:APC family permease [Gemmatimonadales bacterium]
MTATARADESLRRVIGPAGLAASVVNIVVGGSIFVLPAVLSRELGTAAPAAYLTGAAVMGLVAFAFAEAGRRTTVSGGPYAYVERAFGSLPGFLAGLLTWLAVVFACAAVAAALVDSLGTVLPLLHRPVARGAGILLLFAVLTLVNVRGVEAGTRLASATAIAKSAGLLLFVVLAARFVQSGNLEVSWPGGTDGLGRATVLVMFALAGMEVPLCAGGEIRDPARTVPRALAGAIGFVVLLYVIVHLIAQGVLGAGLAASQAPLADALAKGGSGGRALLLAIGAISMFGYLAGDMLGASRILFAFGRDGLLPRKLAAVHPVTRAPHVAVLVHALAAAGLAMTGSFAVLAPIASVAIIVVYLGCCAAAWSLARRQGREASAEGRRFAAVAPVLAIAGLLWVLSHSTRPEFLAVGAVLVVGTATYWAGRRMSAAGALTP